MPLHTFTFTKADALSCVMFGLYVYQPFVDRAAVMQWIIDNIFFGSLPLTAGWGLFVAHKVVEWGFISFYSFLYWLRSPTVESYKTYPRQWPWNSDKVEERQAFDQLQRNALAYIVKFHLVVFCINAALAGWGPTSEEDLDFVRPEKIPPWYVCAYQVIASTVLAETGFYFAHRFMHSTPWLYRNVHKRHHAFKDSTVLTTFYLSAMDSFLSDIIPAGLGVVFFKMHLWTVVLYTTPLIMNAVWVHCGYTFPGGMNPFLVLPMSTDSELTHDYHHRYGGGAGGANFGGAYFLLDRIMGTYVDPRTNSKYLREVGLLKEAEGKKAQ